MEKPLKWIVFCIFALVVLCFSVFSGPNPGDVFREYRHPMKGFRIGERYEWGGANSGVNQPFPFNVDLVDAVKAEVVVNWVQCHQSTTGLKIAWNNNTPNLAWTDKSYIPVIVPDVIPNPQAYYQYWLYSTMNVPLSDLKQGAGNVFKMRIKLDPRPKGQKGWMQNLIYGVYLRIYYKPSKAHPTGRITSPKPGETLQANPQIKAEASGNVKQVEFVAFYEDFPVNGWMYKNWQFAYEGKPRTTAAATNGHIGTDPGAPYAKLWNTSWIPDQSGPMKIAARIVATDGMIYMTEAVDNIAITRNYSIEMYKPYDVPQEWLTRKGVKSEKFDVKGNLSKALDAKWMTTTWCHEGSADFQINGKSAGHVPCNPNMIHKIPFKPGVLKAGQNILSTLKTPGGHHGTEVNWPGVVVFVKYDVPYSGWKTGDPLPAINPSMQQVSAPLTVVAAHGNGRQLVLSIGNQGTHELEIFSADGSFLETRKAFGPQTYTLSSNDYPVGCYLWRITAGGTNRFGKWVTCK